MHVRLKNVLSGEETIQPTEGVFIFIGHDPNNAVFGGQIALNENGYIITDQRYRTNVEGVFAAGEIQDEIWRQVATSVGQGTSAAMSAIQWLEANEERLQSAGCPAGRGGLKRGIAPQRRYFLTSTPDLARRFGLIGSASPS